MRAMKYVGPVTALVLVAGAFVSSPVAASPDPSRADPGAADGPYYAAKLNPEVNALHYNLALSWDGATLSGRATVELQTTRDTDSVRLDLLHSLHVSRVNLDGGSIGFKQVDNGLVMDVGHLVKGATHTFTISYSGVPHTVPAPSRRHDQANGLGWSKDSHGDIYTFQEPYGAFTWYPVNDYPSDKALYDAQITVPSKDTAVFNGRLLGQDQGSGGATTTYRWHLGRPVSSYLTTIAIGPYTGYHTTMPDGTPATYWLLPWDKKLLPSLKSQAANAFSWLEGHAGPYPFGTFGMVVVAGEDAMETQTMITMSRKAFEEPDAVVEHEMAHQWFGDAVSPAEWQDVWLNEGWAMWMQQAYEKYRGGYRYLGGMGHWWPYDNASRLKDGPPGHYSPKDFGELNVYLGPAMMLDLIRQRVGNSEFTRLATTWVTDHEFGNVSREEFITWLNTQTGLSFTHLVNRWLDSPTTPPWR